MEVTGPARAVAANWAGARPLTVAVSVCAPDASPSVQVAVACPVASVVAAAGMAVPTDGLQVTDTLGTALPYRSSTRIPSGCGSCSATTPVCPSPDVLVSVAGTSGVPVTVTVAAVRPGTLAVTACAPTPVPNVKRARATPSARVVDVAGEMLPPPPVTAHVTVAPGTTSPLASSTRTAIESASAAPTVAVVPWPTTGTMRALAGSVAVAVNCAAASAATCADTWWGMSSRGPSVHRVFAIPNALVVDDAGLTAPLPALVAQVTCTPGTGFPNESATRTASESPRAAPSAPVCVSPLAFVTECAGPGNGVALNVAKTMRAPVLGSTARASTRWLSAVEVPRVQRSCTMPCALVRPASAKTLPPPAVTRKLTSCPATG